MRTASLMTARVASTACKRAWALVAVSRVNRPMSSMVASSRSWQRCSSAPISGGARGMICFRVRLAAGDLPHQGHAVLFQGLAAQGALVLGHLDSQQRAGIQLPVLLGFLGQGMVQGVMQRDLLLQQILQFGELL